MWSGENRRILTVDRTIRKKQKTGPHSDDTMWPI